MAGSQTTLTAMVAGSTMVAGRTALATGRQTMAAGRRTAIGGTVQDHRRTVRRAGPTGAQVIGVHHNRVLLGRAFSALAGSLVLH